LLFVVPPVEIVSLSGWWAKEVQFLLFGFGVEFRAAVVCSAAFVSPVLFGWRQHEAKNQTRNQSGRAKHCRTPDPKQANPPAR
jgi:hypothetical protein